MAHFAELDQQGTVLRVLVVNNAELMDGGVESETKGVAFLSKLYGHPNWKQTSYNGNRRKRYAGKGMRYDAELDAFIPQRPYPSWTLDPVSCDWVAPSPQPSDGGSYQWDEGSLAWVAS